jgi:hypothetical protein
MNDEMKRMWNDATVNLGILQEGLRKTTIHVTKVRIPADMNRKQITSQHRANLLGHAVYPWLPLPTARRILFRVEQQSTYGKTVDTERARAGDVALRRVQLPAPPFFLQLYPHHPVHALLTFLP